MLVHEYLRRRMSIIPTMNKVPSIVNWQTRGPTSKDELYNWIQKFSIFDIALVLGISSGYIRVDIDGKDGEGLFEKLIEKTVMPITWEFLTPNNGRGLIYRVPQDLLCRVKLKKVAIVDRKQKHVEVALLGDGCCTNIPPSKGYRWKEGYSPLDIEPAYLPRRLLDKMIQKVDKVKEVPNIEQAQFNNVELSQLEKMLRKCHCFKTDCEDQVKGILDEERWFIWSAFLKKLGGLDVALTFSRLSSKHDRRSETRIKDLSTISHRGYIRCTTLGCDEIQISHCFNKLNVRQGSITNSPIGLFKVSDSEVTKWMH